MCLSFPLVGGPVLPLGEGFTKKVFHLTFFKTGFSVAQASLKLTVTEVSPDSTSSSGMARVPRPGPLRPRHALRVCLNSSHPNLPCPVVNTP